MDKCLVGCAAAGLGVLGVLGVVRETGEGVLESEIRGMHAKLAGGLLLSSHRAPQLGRVRLHITAALHADDWLPAARPCSARPDTAGQTLSGRRCSQPWPMLPFTPSDCPAHPEPVCPAPLAVTTAGASVLREPTRRTTQSVSRLSPAVGCGVVKSSSVLAVRFG